MSEHKNFGIATPKVKILEYLPNVVQGFHQFNFDISAFQYNAILNSPFKEPLFTEHVTNPEGTFAACFPSKRKLFVNNFLSISPNAASPKQDGAIYWTPIPVVEGYGVIERIIQDFPSYYSNINTTDPISRTPQNTTDQSETNGKYSGPIWEDSTYIEASTNSSDEEKKITDYIGSFTTLIFKLEPLSKGDPPIVDNGDIKRCVYQNIINDGLWWGLESDDFIEEENMPFWLRIEIPENPPSPSKFETAWVVSLGIESGENKDRYDLVLPLNKKPELYDYYGPDLIAGNPSDTGNATIRIFEVEESRLITGKDKIMDIGFMTCGGRLIIFVNGNTLIYSRIEKSKSKDKIGEIKAANISKGKIRVFGTNTSANVYAYPMTFAPLSGMAFPIANLKKEELTGGQIKVTKINYSAADDENHPTGEPVAILPSGPAHIKKSKQYGIDAELFEDINGSIKIENDLGFHMQGHARFISADSIPGLPPAGAGGLPSGTDFFFLFMQPKNRVWKGRTILDAKCPYFFRLKGVDEQTTVVPKIPVNDATDDLINVKENSSAPDYFHIKKTATITLYNEYGKYDYLKKTQHGVNITWTWNNEDQDQDNIKTFTGIIISTNTSETAGKETIILNCQDYNYILQNTPIVNSPFYDGLVGYYVIRDLAKRAGIKEFEKNWAPSEKEYFLPSGYSFSSPKMRFNSTDTIFDCIMNVVKRFEAYIYFDANGKMHIDKLPGGLLGYDKNNLVISHEFSSNPIDPNKTPILDQKDITVDFGSTVNQISVLTLHRDTRNPIIIGLGANGNTNRLLFKKLLMIDKPAYGEVSVAQDHVNELSKRVFAPILKTSFRTVGSGSELAVPLEFITVDGVPFRLISISRDYNADNNDFSQSYEAEWLNG